MRRNRRRFRRILVPHDFSDAATQALRVAAGLAEADGARVVVLTVVTPYQPGTGIPEPVTPWLSGRKIVAEARAALSRLVVRAAPI